MKVKKILQILLIFLVLINLITITSYAGGGFVDAKDTSSSGEDDFLGIVKGNIKEPEGAEQAISIAQIVFSVFQVAASAIAIIYALILAIKYITSAPGDRAQIKQHAIIFVVGAVLVFGASGILEMIISFTEENIK